jgi:hypothetical protein
MAVSNTDYNKQDDSNVLRAEDIVLPYNTQKHSEQPLKDTDSSLNENQANQVEPGTAESSDMVQKVNEIPKFDLAEQIMAEQRKITAIKRKAPGRKSKIPDRQPRIQSTGYTAEPLVRALPEEDLIIAEIVARDIEKLYRGDSINLKNC